MTDEKEDQNPVLHLIFFIVLSLYSVLFLNWKFRQYKNVLTTQRILVL